jgi:hypothetical protein
MRFLNLIQVELAVEEEILKVISVLYLFSGRILAFGVYIPRLYAMRTCPKTELSQSRFRSKATVLGMTLSSATQRLMRKQIGS